MSAGDQERADVARQNAVRDEAVRVMEQELWDRGITYYAEGTGTRDLGDRETYGWAVEANRAEAEQRVDDRAALEAAESELGVTRVDDDRERE